MRYLEASMELNPATYRCYEHTEIDLTDEVVRQLSHGKSPVVGYGVARAAKPAKAVDQPFLVIVSCPGNGAPHDVECDGTYTE
jgi:hypothetical protein